MRTDASTEQQVRRESPIGRRMGRAVTVWLKVTALTGTALGISLILEPLIEPDFSPLFLGAVALSSRRWGTQAGIVGALIAIPALLLLFLPPHYAFSLFTWAVALRLLSFLATAALIVWLVDRFHNAENGLRGSLEDVRTREERFRVALLKSPVVVFHQDADLKYIWVYNPFPEHAGVSLLDKSDFDLFPPAEAEQLTQIKREVLLAGKGARREVALTSRRGLRTMDVMLEPFKDSAGNTVGILGTAVDVTEQKVHEEHLRRSGEQLRRLARHLQATHEDERALTSREIHDNVSQMLAALDVELATIAKIVAEGANVPEVCGRLRAIGESLGSTIQSSERISAELRPSLLDNLGLASAIQSELREFQARTGISVAVGPLEAGHLPSDIATAIFRIVQETLGNVERSSEASLVTIRLQKGFSGLVLQIRDNGRSGPAEEGSNSASLSLLDMRERASSFGGKVTLHTVRDVGTTLWVEVPVAVAGAVTP